MIAFRLPAAVASAAVVAVLASACATAPPQPPSGTAVFETHCASCHGRLGEGDGPVAAAISGTVPNLRTLARRNGGQFPADTVARYIDGRDLPDAHGGRVMPVWGEVFGATERLVAGAEAPRARIEAVMEYLRRLQYE